MINIKIICIGKLSQPYWKLAANDYLARISKRTRIETNIITESKLDTVATNIKIETDKINEYILKHNSYQWYLLMTRWLF